ncbi:MAG: dihydrodipicolinate synthase family protein [Promethearchaeota archaeon]
MNLSGIAVPVLSIFSAGFEINDVAQVQLTKHVLKNGADLLFLCGSTGEGQFIQRHHADQQWNVILAAGKAMNEIKIHVPIVFGIYGNTADNVLEAYASLRKVSVLFNGKDTVDGYVIAPPLEKKLDKKELENFLSKIIEGIEGPVLIYNNPATFGGNNIDVDVMESLLDNYVSIRGIKDSSPSFDYKKDVINLIQEREQVSFFTGREGDFFRCLEVNDFSMTKRIGCIPSIGNILNLPARILESCRKGDTDGASNLQDSLNAIRNRIYHAPKTPGKAQRGVKLALSMIYPQIFDITPIVSPNYEKTITDDERKAIKEALEEAKSEGYYIPVQE